MALTPEERKLVDEAQKKRGEIDIEFLERSFASIMIKHPPDVVIAVICKFMDEVSNICISAAASASAEAVTRGRDVDETVDAIRVFIELSHTLVAVERLLIRGVEQEELGEYGIFTYDQKEIGKKLEEMRTMIVQAKNERAVRKRRGY